MGSPGLASRARPGTLREDCQASTHHVKLPDPEPKTRTARGPPTEGRDPRAHPEVSGKAPGPAVPARRSPHTQRPL